MKKAVSTTGDSGWLIVRTSCELAKMDVHYPRLVSIMSRAAWFPQQSLRTDHIPTDDGQLAHRQLGSPAGSWTLDIVRPLSSGEITRRLSGEANLLASVLWRTAPADDLLFRPLDNGRQETVNKGRLGQECRPQL